MLDNPTYRALFQLSTLPSEPRSAILHHCPCRPKGLCAIRSENGNRRIFSEKHCHAHSGAMEIEWQWLMFSPMMKKHIVKAVGCSAIHRQCKKSGPMVCRATRKTLELRSNHTRQRKRTLMQALHSGDGRRGSTLIASKNRRSRQRRPGRSLCFES